jgi:hypothetical protein
MKRPAPMGEALAVPATTPDQIATPSLGSSETNEDDIA